VCWGAVHHNCPGDWLGGRVSGSCWRLAKSESQPGISACLVSPAQATLTAAYPSGWELLCRVMRPFINCGLPVLNLVRFLYSNTVGQCGHNILPIIRH